MFQYTLLKINLIQQINHSNYKPDVGLYFDDSFIRCTA